MSRVNRFEYQDWKGFGARVKKNRELIGITKERFAEMINRSENYIAELEKGNTSCSVHTLHQITKALKVSSDVLLYGDVEMKKEYTNKEILLEMIERCDEEELAVIKEVIVALFPNLDKVKDKKKSNK